MSPEEQERYRPLIAQRLETLESEVLALADDTQAIAPDVSIGRLSRLDSMQQQQMALAGKRRLEDERVRLQEALSRLDRGAYGNCQLCGREIAAERLEYQPDAATCVPCLNRRK